MPFSNDFFWVDGTRNLDLKIAPFENIAQRGVPFNETKSTDPIQGITAQTGNMSLHLHEGAFPPTGYLP